jgi:hypothetical protein
MSQRRASWILVLLATCLALSSATFAAPGFSTPPSPERWLALEAQGSVVTFSGLDPRGITLLLGAAQRLVVDPRTGVAVAELLPAQRTAVSNLNATRTVAGASEGLFQREVLAAFPDAANKSKGHDPYLRKTPAALTLAGNTVRPRMLRRESRPETTCLFEGFEQTPVWYEDGGPWFHFESGKDNNQGDYFWLDENCTAATGSWSASAVMGGDYGQNLACFDNYDTYTDSWLEYGYWIDCVAGYSSASLRFSMTLKSELDYDTFGYYVTLDEIDYYGYYFSGDFSNTWYDVAQDLRNFYFYGDLTGYPDFGLAFNFYSDNQVQPGWGAFVDDIAIVYDQIDISAVYIARNPFRLKVYGTNYMPGAWVYIDGEPVPAMKFKNSGLVVAKGGAYLKGMVMVGRDVCIQVINPNDNSTSCYWFRY